MPLFRVGYIVDAVGAGFSDCNVNNFEFFFGDDKGYGRLDNWLLDDLHYYFLV